jgi:uncharacterized protein (TIGR02118 family)
MPERPGRGLRARTATTMDFCLFLECGPGADDASLRALQAQPDPAALLAGIGGLTGALAHTPARAHDPFLAAEPPPSLVLQLYFARLLDLEAAAGRGGPVAAWVETLAQRGGVPPTWETVLTRRYAVAQARPGDAVGPWCTYLVAYEGPAEDAHAWMDHYLTQHPPLMRQLPGLRELEICSPLEAVAWLPGRRRRQLQRNKVAFDSPQALDAALQSPVREQMRRDFTTFPPYAGRVTHHAMLTRALQAG